MCIYEWLDAEMLSICCKLVSYWMYIRHVKR